MYCCYLLRDAAVLGCRREKEEKIMPLITFGESPCAKLLLVDKRYNLTRGFEKPWYRT